MPDALSPDFVRRFEQDGYLFPLPALGEGEVAHYRERVEELERHFGGRIGPMQVVQPQLHFRWAHDLCLRPSVLDAVTDLIGPDVLVHSASIFCKQPGDGRYIAWHQDGHYWRLSEPRLVSAWIALSSSTPRSGCMRVVRGTHRYRLPHLEEPDAGNMLASGLRLDAEVDLAEVVDVCLGPGQMSLHHERIVHGSEPNRSLDKRIGFAIRYVVPDVSQVLDHHEVILARGRDDHGFYEHVAEPPGTDMEECLARQGAFAEAIRRRRIGSKAQAGPSEAIREVVGTGTGSESSRCLSPSQPLPAREMGQAPPLRSGASPISGLRGPLPDSPSSGLSAIGGAPPI